MLSISLREELNNYTGKSRNVAYDKECQTIAIAADCIPDNTATKNEKEGI